MIKELTEARLISEKDVARMICVSVRCVQNWRLRGGGPPLVKLGRSVRYQVSDILMFIEERKHSNTAFSSR